jgi:outer membrane protein assembly factor BamB/FlaG/FlaF family flagellin (archaellin)
MYPPQPDLRRGETISVTKKPRKVGGRMDEKGLSPIVGTFMLIGITVAVASIIAIEIAPWAVVSELPPNVTLGAEAESFDNVVMLTITHEGGEALDTGELEVFVEDEDGSREVTDNMQWSDQISLGDAGVVTYLYWTDPEGEEIRVKVVHPPSESILFNTAITITLGREEWPMFHHDVGHTGYSDSPPAESHLLSKNSTEAEIVAPPIVVNGRAYIGSGDNFYCLDADNLEKIIWTSNQRGLEYWENFNASPAVVGGRVYLPLYSTSEHALKTYCLDARDGRVMWGSEWVTAWSPVVVGGRLYGGSAMVTFCLDADDGALLWSTEGVPEGVTIYTFRDNNQAYENVGEDLLTPSEVVENVTDAGDEAYENLGGSDDKRWMTTLSRTYFENDQQYYKFKVDEDINDILKVKIAWEGYAEDFSGLPDDTRLWLWSWGENWKLVDGPIATEGDHWLTHEITANFENYVNPSTGELWAAVTKPRGVWWNENWSYRKRVTTYNSYPENYQFIFMLNYTDNLDSHCNSDFSDLRFTEDENGPELSYWIENYVPGKNAVVWVRKESTDDSFWMYYGNEDASSAESNENEIFDFFDDFEDGDADGWSLYGAEVVGDLLKVGDEDESYSTATAFTGVIPSGRLIFWAKYVPGWGWSWWRVGVWEFVPSYTWVHILAIEDYVKSPVKYYDNGGKSTGLSWETDKWYRHELHYDENNICRYYFDDQPRENIGRIPHSDSVGYVAFRDGAYSAVYIDEVWVAKYVDPEPTTSLGSEEPVGGLHTDYAELKVCFSSPLIGSLLGQTAYNPGGNNLAYEHDNLDMMDNPLQVVENATKAEDEAYENLRSSDDKRWITSLADEYSENDFQYYKFEVKENRENILKMTVEWEGHARDLSGDSTCDIFLYIWNLDDTSWEQVSTASLAGPDTTLTFENDSPLSYIAENGEVWLAAARSEGSPDWWNDNWKHRRRALIDGSFPEGYQFRLDIDHYPDMQSDFDDLRFTEDEDGPKLRYWIENYVPGENAVVWVRKEDNTDNDFWMYYGNGAAESGGNAANTFDLFDDFEDGNTSGWVATYCEIFVDSENKAFGNYSMRIEARNPTHYSKVKRAGIPRSGKLICWGRVTETEAIDQLQFEVNRGDDYSADLMWWDDLESNEWVYYNDSPSGVSWDYDTWYRLELHYHADDNCTYFFDGENIGFKDVPSVYGTPSHVGFTAGTWQSWIGDIFARAWVDRVIAAKLVEPEPEVSFGSEETIDGGLHTDYVVLWVYYPPPAWLELFSPAVANGKVYARLGSGISSLDAYNGDIIWSYSVGLTSPPTIAHDRLYFGAGIHVYSLDLDTGEFIRNLGVGTASTPSAADGKLYVGSSDGLLCLNADLSEASGWDPFSKSGISNPAVARGRVYVGANDNFYCLDEENGGEIWSYETGGGTFTAPAIANGRVYVCSGDTLYCFGPASPI